LSFVHTHTGETLSTVYFEGGEYRAGELGRINQLLRDFRTGDVYQGRAIDVRLPRFATAKLHELALGMGRGGVGYYPRFDFVHLDNGRVRFW
jgi:uncharacterized protein YcbK (DUF882 family)